MRLCISVSEPIDEPINEPIERSLEEKILQQMRSKPNCTYDTLASAIVKDSKVPKHQSTAHFGALDDPMVLKIIEVLRGEPGISQDAMGERLGATRRVIQKHINILKETGCIERVGSKRYGHWVIHE